MGEAPLVGVNQGLNGEGGETRLNNPGSGLPDLGSKRFINWKRTSI